MKKTIFFFSFFCVVAGSPCSAQHQEREVFLYNVSFGSISAGIGAMINKPHNTSCWHAFLRGAWQGAVGGLVNYTGKKTTYLINKENTLAYALPAKIIHCAGISIIENAALYNPFLQNWNFDYGPVRIDFSLHGKIKFRLLPETIYAAVQASTFGKFNLNKSLVSGAFVFESKNVISLSGQIGRSFGRAFVYTNNPYVSMYKNQIFAHEYIHTFQYSEYQVLNTWLKPLGKKITSKILNTIFSRYVYFDAPYVSLFYELEGRYPANRYYKNFYEFEAQRFSTNAFVPYRH